ncbi:phage portal protein [Microbacterium gubbeenense]|uniref:phage portal protein n=1 Tax=Microbacterium gubbeenense TaxID=159896 RepID=UPI001B7FA01E|nr:phage portal protein [Microbacterium gubbeenense]
MAFRDAIAALLGRGGPNTQIEWLGPTFRQMVLGLTPEELYRTQPHLRIVLSFVARNVAHLGLKAYAREGDNDRRRLGRSDDPLAALIARPNPNMTTFELVETLAADLGLYDVAYWWLREDVNAPSGWALRPIPPAWVTGQSGGNAFAPSRYEVTSPRGRVTYVKADDMIVFHGWNPGRPKHGTSPVETLKQVLSEQVQAWSYREQVWQRGGRVGAYLTRPKDATWSDAARERFARDWKDRWTGKDGKKAGGTPILEDGMELHRLGFSAREDEWAEVAKLALSTVAAVYHVNPVMVGILDNANFSNTREFRKMLYSETLGPTLARIEERVNAFLVPRVTTNPDAYVEFNIEEKLQGSFEEQASILSTSTGAPWMTVNEARARMNLPAIDGGDQRVVPLNVLVGGQASPRDSGTQNERSGRALSKGALAMLEELNASHPQEATGVIRALPAKSSRPVRAKAQVGDGHEAKAEEIMDAFFDRQREAVLARVNGAKDDTWWNAERWDKELAEELLALALQTTKDAAAATLAAFGLDPDAYDVARTEAFLAEVAASRAAMVNATTRDQIGAILAGSGPDGVADPAHAFEVAKSSRSATIAATLVTTFAAFAATEAARQNGGGRKTWIVTSGDPRASHAAMNGETVPVDATFSNGAKWPGDPVLGADGVSNCRCDVEITFG